MVVCLCEVEGLYANINSKGDRRGSLLIPQTLNPFLSWDSHLEISENGYFTFDEYIINRSQCVGRLHASHINEILERIKRSVTIPDNDKIAIQAALTPLIPQSTPLPVVPPSNPQDEPEC
jgi:hypothetical protein